MAALSRLGRIRRGTSSGSPEAEAPGRQGDGRLSPDDLAAVPHVEHILHLAADRGGPWLFAALMTLGALLLPSGTFQSQCWELARGLCSAGTPCWGSG